MADRGAVAAAQAALAGEHAAVWGYGRLGPLLPVAERSAALADLTTHRDRRNRLAQLLGAAGATPVGTKPAYALPFPVEDATSARRLAVYLEHGCAARYADLVAAWPDKTVRLFAATALTGCARTALAWGGTPSPLPGLRDS